MGQPGIRSKLLNAKQCLFIDRWLICKNIKQAAIEAGYNPNSAANTGAKILALPAAKRLIDNAEQKVQKHHELELVTILTHLFFCTTRTARDFADESGKLITNINELSERAAASVDGIKQRVETWTDHDGVQHERVTTELKLVPKASALDMALKHKGAYQPIKVETTNKPVFDVSALYGPRVTSPTAVEERIMLLEEQARGNMIEAESKRL